MIFRRLALSYEDWTAVSKGANYVEFDWIGIDDQGQIGIFCSCGMGYIPPRVFSSYNSYVGLNDFLYDAGYSTTAEIISKESGMKDFWRDWALKGLFAFDYYDVHRQEKFDRYDLIAKPGRPLLARVVPEMMAFDEIVPWFKLSFNEDLSFSQMKENLL